MGKHSAPINEDTTDTVILGDLLPVIAITDAASAFAIATALDTAADAEWKTINHRAASVAIIREHSQLMQTYLRLANLAWREYMNLGGTASIGIINRVNRTTGA